MLSLDCQYVHNTFTPSSFSSKPLAHHIPHLKFVSSLLLFSIIPFPHHLPFRRITTISTAHLHQVLIVELSVLQSYFKFSFRRVITTSQDTFYIRSFVPQLFSTTTGRIFEAFLTSVILQRTSSASLPQEGDQGVTVFDNTASVRHASITHPQVTLVSPDNRNKVKAQDIVLKLIHAISCIEFSFPSRRAQSFETDYPSQIT